MDLTVRFARAKEAVAVHRILMDAFAPYEGKIKPPFKVFKSTPDGIAAGIRKRRHRYAVAVVDRAPVGTLRLTPIRADRRCDYWLLSRLAVLPEFQGSHIARRLIDWMHEKAIRHEVPELRGHVRTALPKLLRFYQRCGYRILGYRSLPGFPRYVTVIGRRPG